MQCTDSSELSCPGAAHMVVVVVVKGNLAIFGVSVIPRNSAFLGVWIVKGEGMRRLRREFRDRRVMIT